MPRPEQNIFKEFTTKYKDALIVIGVVVAATTSSGNLALNAEKPNAFFTKEIRLKLGEIERRLSTIEHDVQELGKWQDDKDQQLDGRGRFMSCAVQQIHENRRAADAERACDLQVPR